MISICGHGWSYWMMVLPAKGALIRITGRFAGNSQAGCWRVAAPTSRWRGVLSVIQQRCGSLPLREVVFAKPIAQYLSWDLLYCQMELIECCWQRSIALTFHGQATSNNVQ